MYFDESSYMYSFASTAEKAAMKRARYERRTKKKRTTRKMAKAIAETFHSAKDSILMRVWDENSWNDNSTCVRSSPPFFSSLVSLSFFRMVLNARYDYFILQITPLRSHLTWYRAYDILGNCFLRLTVQRLCWASTALAKVKRLQNSKRATTPAASASSKTAFIFQVVRQYISTLSKCVCGSFGISYAGIRSVLLRGRYCVTQ